jgi:hypothetical protein
MREIKFMLYAQNLNFMLYWCFSNRVLQEFTGQSEPAPMTTPVGRSVHRMGWMIRLFFIRLFTFR